MTKFRKHFREGNESNHNHPTYVVQQKGKEYDFVSLTHAEQTKGSKNIKLEKNPNPKDKKVSYVRPKVLKSNKSSFGGRIKGWMFADSDKKKVDKIVNNQKKSIKK